LNAEKENGSSHTERFDFHVQRLKFHLNNAAAYAFLLNNYRRSKNSCIKW